MINYKKVAAIPIMVALASCAGNVDKEALIDKMSSAPFWAVKVT